MHLYNTLTKKIEDLVPDNPDQVRMYSCGPTVYDRAHIGNLASFIYADVMRRSLKSSYNIIHHVMNFTDVDDKTINASKVNQQKSDSMSALKQLTELQIKYFINDAEKIGIDTKSIQFIKATDSIKEIQNLINDLYKKNIAYIAEDGIYFSISEYKKQGHDYGVLSHITELSTNESRINNDEYDKESAHDFALWKTKKDDEPSWEYILDGKDLTGRPGWHIECSAMSVNALGQPFDIHTGGIDLIFPHHENEIAQNTGINSKKLANVFVHNEHLLVDNNKMSKSLNNFYTLEDIKDNNIMPLALRMFVLQAHYRSVLHFTWDNLKSAENRLKNYQAIADLRWQPIEQSSDIDSQCIDNIENNIKNALNDDLDTPKVLEILSEFENKCAQSLINKQTVVRFNIFLDFIDDVLGFNLKQSDISKDIKSLIADRDRARSSKEYAVADQKRDQLKKNGIAIRDTENGTIWYRI